MRGPKLVLQTKSRTGRLASAKAVVDGGQSEPRKPSSKGEEAVDTPMVMTIVIAIVEVLTMGTE